MMNQAASLLVFAGTHWVLVCLAIILLGLIGFYETRRMSQGGINAHELVKAMNADEVVVLDVRGRDLFRKGHILNAENFPQSMLKDQVKKLEKYQDKLIVLVDADGMQVKKSLPVLKTAAIDNVKVLTGGMRAWLDAKLPIHKDK